MTLKKHEIDEIKRLYAQGYSKTEISRRLNISRNTTAKYAPSAQKIEQINAPKVSSETVILQPEVTEERVRGVISVDQVFFSIDDAEGRYTVDQNFEMYFEWIEDIWSRLTKLESNLQEIAEIHSQLTTLQRDFDILANILFGRTCGRCGGDLYLNLVCEQCKSVLAPGIRFAAKDELPREIWLALQEKGD